MSQSFFKLKVKKDPETGTCIASLYYKGESRSIPYLNVPYEDYIRDRKDTLSLAYNTYRWLEEHLENKAAKLAEKGTEHVPTQMCRYIRSILPERSIQNAEELRFAKTKRKGIPSLKKHVKAYEDYCKEKGTNPVILARYCDPYVLIETKGQNYMVQSCEGMKAELANAVKYNDIDFYYLFTVPQIWDEVITDPDIPNPVLVATMLEVWSHYWEKNENVKEKDKSLLSLKDFFKNFLNSPNIATDAYNYDPEVFGILVQSALLYYNTEDAIDEYTEIFFAESPDESVYNEFLITPDDC